MFIPVKLSVRTVFVNNLNRDNKSAKEYDDYIQVPFQPPVNLPNHTVFPQTEVKCGIQTRARRLVPASMITSRKLTCTRMYVRKI